MDLLKKWGEDSRTGTEERKKRMLEEWNGKPTFPDFLLSRRLLEQDDDDGREEERSGGEIVIDLFDQLKIESYPADKLAADTFLTSADSDQALILPFFSDEAITISEVVLDFQFDFNLCILALTIISHNGDL